MARVQSPHNELSPEEARPRTRRETMARWISIVAHPFVTTMVMLGAVTAQRSSSSDRWRSVALIAVFTILPVGVLMYRQVRRGAWENTDASNARERPILFAVSASGLLLLLGYLLVAQPQSFMIRGLYGALGMIAACAIVTRWIKVSLHLAFATLNATILLLMGATTGWLLALLIPPLVWSRLALGRHRPVELALGGLIGIMTGLAIRFL
jgi:hypothetical protein